MKKIIENHRWKILFGLWSMQGIAALFWIWLIPADAENGVFLGFTPARLWAKDD